MAATLQRSKRETFESIMHLSPADSIELLGVNNLLVQMTP